LFYTTIGIVIGGLATLPIGGWPQVTSSDWLLFILTGFFTGGAHFMMIETFRYGEA